MQSRWEHKRPEALKRLMDWVKEVSEWLKMRYEPIYTVVVVVFNRTKMSRLFFLLRRYLRELFILSAG